MSTLDEVAISGYPQWQTQDHAALFDFRRSMKEQDLNDRYHSMNDVRLLTRSLSQFHPKTVLEVGCATGDFYRYLIVRYPEIDYFGVDVSHPAILRARAKYPGGRFLLHETGRNLPSFFQKATGLRKVDVVFSADVLHHQSDPLGLLGELLQLAAQAVIVRCRTRDQGATVWDPSRSRQFAYGGWVPYIVLNLAELLQWIQRQVPGAQVSVVRSYTVLGQRHGRQLPPECSFKKIGTAETALAISLQTTRPGTWSIRNRVDKPETVWDYRWNTLRRRLGRLLVWPGLQKRKRP